jgi:hypothetical protein
MSRRKIFTQSQSTVGMMWKFSAHVSLPACGVMGTVRILEYFYFLSQAVLRVARRIPSNLASLDQVECS